MGIASLHYDNEYFVTFYTPFVWVHIFLDSRSLENHVQYDLAELVLSA